VLRDRPDEAHRFPGLSSFPGKLGGSFRGQITVIPVHRQQRGHFPAPRRPSPDLSLPMPFRQGADEPEGHVDRDTRKTPRTGPRGRFRVGGGREGTATARTRLAAQFPGSACSAGRPGPAAGKRDFTVFEAGEATGEAAIPASVTAPNDYLAHSRTSITHACPRVTKVHRTSSARSKRTRGTTDLAARRSLRQGKPLTGPSNENGRTEAKCCNSFRQTVLWGTNHRNQHRKAINEQCDSAEKSRKFEHIV
jgi:hypothetical protein